MLRRDRRKREKKEKERKREGKGKKGNKKSKNIFGVRQLRGYIRLNGIQRLQETSVQSRGAEQMFIRTRDGIFFFTSVRSFFIYIDGMAYEVKWPVTARDVLSL